MCVRGSESVGVVKGEEFVRRTVTNEEVTWFDRFVNTMVSLVK